MPCKRKLLREIVKNKQTNIQTFAFIILVEQVCATFRAACQARGLLENDNHWDETLEEAVLCRSANSLRELFAIIICTCEPSDPLQLWNKYKDALSENIPQWLQLQSLGSDIVTNEFLKLIGDKIISLSGKRLSEFRLPIPQRSKELSSEVVRELDYDIGVLQIHVNDIDPSLLPEQRHVVDTILHRINSEKGGLFFLDAPGRTGKTFVLNLLWAHFRKDRNIALAVASSGIAATLLTGRRTAHSVFKLPLNLTTEQAPTCNTSKSSGRGALLQQCKLIVWDECTMSHKHAVEAVNRSLQDIRGNQAVIGGVVVLLAGDFREMLPVIEIGTPAEEINACLKSSTLWTRVEKFHLTCNMRPHLYNDQESSVFASNLLEIGEGRVVTDRDGQIEFNENFCHPTITEADLIVNVFLNLESNINDQ